MGTTSSAPAYPIARTFIALPRKRGLSEFRNASTASAITAALVVVIAVDQATSDAAGGRAAASGFEAAVIGRLALYSLSSKRWPSGSRRKQRVSAPFVTGGVRNVPPRPRSSSYVAWQSSTRIVNRLSRRSGSAGGSRTTLGLSGVGPPPSTSSSQEPANSSTTDEPYSR